MTEKKITYFFKHLGKETSLSDFRDIYDDQVEFKDPFNEVKSIKSVHGVFAHMYRNLDNPRFVIREYIAKDNIAYVKWVFSFSFKNESMQNAFEGVSRLKMNEEGKVIQHTDYWDAAEHMYEKMPFIGWLLRKIKQKILRS